MTVPSDTYEQVKRAHAILERLALRSELRDMKAGLLARRIDPVSYSARKQAILDKLQAITDRYPDLYED